MNTKLNNGKFLGKYENLKSKLTKLKNYKQQSFIKHNKNKTYLTNMEGMNNEQLNPLSLLDDDSFTNELDKLVEDMEQDNNDE